MKSFEILKSVEFNEDHPVAETILFDQDTRLIRFSLLPGQSIKEHSSPSSPVYIIILEGNGFFSGQQGDLREYGKNTCIKFELGEKHFIQAGDDKLVLIALLRGSPRIEKK